MLNNNYTISYYFTNFLKIIMAMPTARALHFNLFLMKKDLHYNRYCSRIKWIKQNKLH